MTNPRHIKATYHFLGSFACLVPVIGLVGLLIFKATRKTMTVSEKNHFRGVLNFVISLWIYSLIIYFLSSISFTTIVCLTLWSIAFCMTLWSGFNALKGKDVVYPFAIPFLKLESESFGMALEEISDSSPKPSTDDSNPQD